MTGNKTQEEPPPTPKHAKEPRQKLTKKESKPIEDISYKVMEMQPITDTKIELVENLTISTNDELDEKLNSMLEKVDGIWTCTVCGKTDPTQNNKACLKRHIEGKHIGGLSHPCNSCGKTFRSKNSLQWHNSQKHRVYKNDDK